MNLLLITFSFPPAGGVGVLRALSLAKYLPASGIRVDVLTARNAPAVGKDVSLLQQIPAAVTVHRTWTLDLPFTLRKAIKKLLSGRPTSAATHAATAAPTLSSPRPGNPLKRLIANLLLPDPQIGWLPFAFPAACRIIRSRSIDAVLITVPPFSSAKLVARLRRRFPQLPIVLDFRDEWLTTTLNLVSFNNNQRAQTVAHDTESEAVRDATVVVAVTEAARQELIARYPEPHAPDGKSKVQCIPNGFEPRSAIVTAPQPSSRDVVLLTYSGSIYGSTDPAPLVDAVLSLPPDLRRRLRIRFIGHIETAALRASLETLGENVELLGFLPQAKALQALNDTDYLLLISHDRINVSAKFYDYLAAARPIVAAVHPAGEVRRLLEETRAGAWADITDPQSIARMLTQILTQGAQPFLPDHDRIAGYRRSVLAERYAALLKSL